MSFLNKIFIYETRPLAYLDMYVGKLRQLKFDPVILSDENIRGNKMFETFVSVYEHLSVNSLNFELACFARYFIIADALSDNNSFILSDSDIYVTNKLVEFKEASFKDVFVGSEGFNVNGSEMQISPHFSIWNKDLILSFIDFLTKAYKRNAVDRFLKKYYDRQTKNLGRTAISDMTMLYLWVKDRHIPYINSNSISCGLGIDHNISSLYASDGVFNSWLNRKRMEVLPSGEVNFLVRPYEERQVTCIHFQGGYKRILLDFYKGNFVRFNLFSYYINNGRKISILLNKLKNL